MQQNHATNWIKLALGSLIIPGITAIILVLLRTLEIDSSEWGNIFKTALVIHVDLSVYIWMVTGALLLWNIENHITNNIHKLAFSLAVVGTVLIAVSGFIGSPEPILNNYIPVIENIYFFIGLGLFSLGALVLAFNVANSSKELSTRLMATLYIFSVILVISSFISLDNSSSGYYEFLFWGGGHILQLMVTLLMMVIWVRLFNGNINKSILNTLYLIIALPVIYGLYIHFNNAVDTGEYRSGMTNMMIWGNGVAPTILAILILIKTAANSFAGAKGSALYSSILMFLTGGAIATQIDGINTIIPAHYHGSIVGVTLSIMGLVYFVLPKNGYKITMSKTAYAQPIIYTIGQLMHIAGLAISGTHGAARKTVGEAGNLAQTTDMSVFLTRTGGLVAVLGGVLFIVIVYKALKTKTNQQ